MALPTNTATTYLLPSSIRQNLQDVVYNVDPAETPFLSNVRQGVAKSTLHEWQVDALAAPADNFVLEGDDPTAKVLVDTVKRTNYTQISQKTVIVTETDIAVENAGIVDRLAYEMEKASRELKRDIETTLVGTNKGKAVGAAGTARQAASVDAWIFTNDIIGTGLAASPVGDGVAGRTDGTTGAFVEANLTAAIDLIWASGGDPTMVILSSGQKRLATAFTGNATRFKDADDRAVVNAVDVYVSDYGELQIVPDRYIRSRDVLIIDPEYWMISYLRPFQDRPLAKSGDSEKRQLIVEWTLAALNEKSSGGVFDRT
jgi:hypothetical protein